MRRAGSQLALEFGGSAGVAMRSPTARKVRRDAVVRLVEYAPFPRVQRDPGWRRGFTLDLSPRGLCLRAEVAAVVGSLLHVIVRGVDGRPFLDAVARVAWIRERGPVRIGLEFVAARAPRGPRAPRLRPAAAPPPQAKPARHR
jgi:hypothetical protein